MEGRLTLWWRWERGQQLGVASVSDAASGARWSSPHPGPSDRTVCDCERGIIHMWWWKRVSFCTLTHITQPETFITLTHNHIQTKPDTEGSQQRVRHPTTHLDVDSTTFQVTHFSNRILILSAGICVCVCKCVDEYILWWTSWSCVCMCLSLSAVLKFSFVHLLPLKYHKLYLYI